MQITRKSRQAATVSLVAMVDVLMIMLVFFMVTSTYLDLDMIPLAEAADDTAAGAAGAASAPATRGAAVIMVRIGADGAMVHRGQPLSSDGLADLVARQVADGLSPDLVLLPSAWADVQALVSALDAAAAAGALRTRVIRLEPQP
jgi:biopolymer transport protein ExbD